MRTKYIKSLVTKSLILMWSILCVSIFVYYPGKVSVLYGSSLVNWPSLISKLGRIEISNYILNLLWALFGIIIISFISICIGGFLIPLLLEKFGNNSETPLFRSAHLGTAFLFGLAFLSIIFLALAKINQLTSFHVILVWLFGFIIGIRPLSKFVSKFSLKEFINPFNKSDSRTDTIIIWLTIITLAFSLMYSTARLSYDSVALYFSNAKIIALTDHIQYFLNDSYIVSSLQTGIQYSALIQVFGDQAARMFSWINGIVIIIFSLAIGEKAGLSKPARLILLAFILTSTSFIDLLGDGKIDLASSAPAMAAIYWMMINNKNPNRRFFLIIGVLTGLAMISRPFNIFLLVFFIGLYYLQYTYHQHENDLTKALRYIFQSVLWISLGVVCLITYHLIANWAIIGDPLAPLKDYQNANISGWQWALDPKQIWLFRLLYPFVITYLNTSQSLGNITPLFIAFLPAILITGLRNKLGISQDLIVIAFAAFITLLIWVILLFTIFEIRYVLFLWIILFIPAAYIIEKILKSDDPLFQITSRLLIIILLTFIAVRIVYISLDTYSPIDNLGNPQCYDFPFCQFLKPINEMANPGDRVLTLNAFRYYLRTDLFACSTTHEEYSNLELLSKGDGTAFWTEVYRDGYKFIAYESNYSVRHLDLRLIPNPYNTPPWLILKPIFGQPGDPVVAYQIQVKDPPVKTELSCERTISGVWNVQQLQK